VATVRSFRCFVVRNRSGGRLRADSRPSGGYRLQISVPNRGYRMYDLGYDPPGGFGEPFFFLRGPGGTFSNLNGIPRPPAPSFAGAVSFGRRSVGAGVIEAWNLPRTSSVAFAGRAPCTKPRRRR
jgi:hypothetical protein